MVCDESASLAGVMPTQTVSTAQALLAHNKHRSLERDPESEDALLEQLTIWAYGLSPHLERWRDNALTIEIGSCLRLHQGLGPLLERVDTEMSLRGLTVSVGVAETRDAAWLLSHVEAEPQRVLKALGWLISHSRFLLPALQLIEPVHKGFTAPFAERGERDIE